jgi:HSP20 family protein
MSPMFRSSADLFAELNRMQSMLDQVFPTTGGSIRSQAGTGFPVLNVGTTPTAVEVQALAPGLDPASLEITVDRGLLVIAGERRSELPPADERASVYAQERFTGRFRRVVSLPEDADPGRVEATYRDGVLRISVAKRESSLPRRIEVN